MCTVTVLPRADGGFRVGVNRDESRRRPEARPPEVRDVAGGVRAILPIDPVSGGTWVAVNDAGLAMALLNVNVRPAFGAARTASRGLIIPALIDCRTAREAGDRARRLDPKGYQPFRLVMVDAAEVFEVCSADQRRITVSSPGPPGGPGPDADAVVGRCEGGLLFCSSGLGDDVADRPRRRLWRAMARDASREELLSVQDRFHRHHWADRPELSVAMRRPDARTVSYTEVDVTPTEVDLRYQPGPPDAPEGPTHEQRLDRRIASAEGR